MKVAFSFSVSSLENVNADGSNNGHIRLLRILFFASNLGYGLLGGQYVGTLLE